MTMRVSQTNSPLLRNAGAYGYRVSAGPVTIGMPVPEPQTYAMLLLGLGLVGFMARRRAG